MNSQSLPNKLILLISLFVVVPVLLRAQGTPVTVGPVTVTVPAGWTGKADLQGERKRFYSPESNTVQYFALGFSEPQTTNDDVLTHHNGIINNLSALVPAGTKPESGILGQFLWTRTLMQRPGSRSQPETVILYSTKVGSLYVGIDVDATSADLVAKDLPAVEAMIRRAVLKNVTAAPAAAQAVPQAPQPPAKAQAPFNSMATTPQPADSTASSGADAMSGPMPTGPASLNQYVFTVPPGWTPQHNSDGITIFSPVSMTREQCQISMWPMRPASGNLAKDAAMAFQQIFRPFEPRYQTSDGSPVAGSLIRGTSGAGWGYVIIKQGIGIHGPYETMLGSVMAAKLNNTVAIVSTISKAPLVSSCLGELIADAWPRFFYSLDFRGWVPTDQSATLKQALAGTWTSATAAFSDQITFSPNGRYGGASGAQNYNLQANGTVLTTTQAFFGDGAYSLRGNAITFKPDDRSRAANTGMFRVEQESKDGGRTWTPVLYLLKVSVVDGKDYEVRYQKTGN